LKGAAARLEGQINEAQKRLAGLIEAFTFNPSAQP
jgi:hypothetical protein